MSPDELKTGLSKLATDINSGTWGKKYGDLKQQAEYDAGYRILIAS